MSVLPASHQVVFRKRSKRHTHLRSELLAVLVTGSQLNVQTCITREIDPSAQKFETFGCQISALCLSDTVPPKGPTAHIGTAADCVFGLFLVTSLANTGLTAYLCHKRGQYANFSRVTEGVFQFAKRLLNELLTFLVTRVGAVQLARATAAGEGVGFAVELLAGFVPSECVADAPYSDFTALLDVRNCEESRHVTVDSALGVT